MSGAHAEMAIRMRPSAWPFHLAKVFSIVSMWRRPHRAVELERRGIADRGAGPVVGPLAEQEAQAGPAERLGIVVDVVGILEQEGDAAAQAFQRAQLRHHPALVGGHVGQRDRRQAAGKRRPVRRREVLEHAARHGHGEMGVDVGEARHHHAAAPSEPLAAESARHSLVADRARSLAVDRDRGAVVHRVVVVAGDDEVSWMMWS
jgi:hypothetical protein